MSKLIVKSPYIKGASGKRASGYLQYIATRENVELLPSVAEPDADGYLSYIANRPRSHGLFGDGNAANLAEAMAELEAHTGNVWTHILSLRREDAARLGYDSAKAWQNLLKAHRNDIAAAMKIPPNSFRWYAAFHNEGEHPHVHMMAWSTNPKQGYLSTACIEEIKSKLTNSIFKHEMLHLYEQKGASRDELVREARRAMAELIERMEQGVCDHPEVERLMSELARRLETVTGKKQYGYLPKGVKRLVDEIVDQMEQLPVVSECYAWWRELQAEVQSYYTGAEPEKLPLSRQKEFRAIKNAVIHEAERMRLGVTVAETPASPQYRGVPPTSVAARLLYHIAQIFRGASTPPAKPVRKQVDSKLRQKIREKKIALGHAVDEQEDFTMNLTL